MHRRPARRSLHTPCSPPVKRVATNAVIHTYPARLFNLVKRILCDKQIDSSDAQPLLLRPEPSAGSLQILTNTRLRKAPALTPKTGHNQKADHRLFELYTNDPAITQPEQPCFHAR